MFIEARLTTSKTATEKGLGQHLLLLEPDQASSFLHVRNTYELFWLANLRQQTLTDLQSFYVFNGSYAMSTALIKISLLVQYMRLYRRGTRLFNVCGGLAVFVCLWGIAYSVIAWVPCVPVSDYWTVIYEQDISGLRCYGYGSQYVEPFKATYESHAAVNMLLDLIVMGLPIPLYFEPGAHGRTKMGLVGIILMGTLYAAPLLLSATSSLTRCSPQLL
jgi:hypothetical protein